MLEVGSIAPDFTLLDQNGDSVSLSNFVGKKIILYFYSKDNTPGCTKQACGYAQNYPRFKEKDTIIIGISKDTVVSHKKFEEKYQLPFILLANPELDVLQAYDVWKEKNIYRASESDAWSCSTWTCMCSWRSGFFAGRQIL